MNDFTKLAHTWILNEEPSYITARILASGDNAPNELKNWYAHFMPKLKPSFWKDALNVAWKMIDWDEIVEALRE